MAHAAFGDDFFGVHMVWGAVNELTTLRFYRLLRRDTDDPLLRDVLGDIIRQEALHYGFYAARATERLDGNPRGQRLVRAALERLWSPVGVGLRSRSDARRLMHGLFDTEPAQVAQMDAAINRLPGLAELDLVGRELARG